jgi:chromosome segregation protein
VSAPARLLALRLQGFKSFAERTSVEFGAGISAVVGPNGSGKSNLADGLRWALGEQGRSLRIRRSEDVIFAGSDRRAAIGMADVTLVLDNADGLLPVDYSVLELGRRLYRSGENDYLLNKQRVRLRDLVDLLDGAHLADNAFLFIGQGMVDQALALRPEERRPLFEEVAGVRRHERRRRKAEEQLAEAEANIARLQDIIAELRPQVRRLAAQAEQQATRRSAGDDLVSGLLLAAHARWHDAASRTAAADDRLRIARADADRSMAALQDAETAASALIADLAARAVVEAERQVAHELAGRELSDVQLREVRVSGELAATARDRAWIDDERASTETDLAAQRRILAEPLPARDVDAESALLDAERALAEALQELGALRAAGVMRSAEASAMRRAEAARASELDTAHRRAAEAERRLADERGRADAIAGRLATDEGRLAAARTALAAAAQADSKAAVERESARAAAESAEGIRQAAVEAASTAGSRLAELAGRLEALRARLADEERRPIARAARRRGGRRIDEDLAVTPGLRAAVETALGELGRAYLVPRTAVAAMASERGVLVVRDEDGPDRSSAGAKAAAAHSAAMPVRVAELGGGMLRDALRLDPTGVAGLLLETACWVPDLAALLELQPALPPGWIAVVRDGSALAGPLSVSLGRPEGALERKAEMDRLAEAVAAAGAEAQVRRAAADASSAAAAAARGALDAARDRAGLASAAGRRFEEEERAIGRAVEAAAREAAWHVAQVDRLAAEVARALAAEQVLATPPAGDGRQPTGEAAEPAGIDRSAAAAWESRVAEIRVRRDRLAAEQAERDGTRRDAEARRARAEAAVAIDEERIDRTGRELSALVEREHRLRDELEGLNGELAAAEGREAAARTAVDEARAADAADRDRLASAEAAVGEARERVRLAEERLRAAEVADLEARLGLDAVRDGLLVELAGLGELGLRALVIRARPGEETAVETAELGDSAAGDEPAAGGEPANGDAQANGDERMAAALEAAVAAAAPRWAAERPLADPPSVGRLAVLRRRFHELGAPNPFAVEEYAELKARLDGLEAQEADLLSAIAGTRRLIEDLSTMVAEQFRTTFQALEVAFDSRFRQLFGGGFARLALTDPGDLAATGVDIVARPPGKKAQALAMLSGGERALTAVALLFAMLEVRPVPFCVLDEVDAALDEANIGRFVDALRSLADGTQFIVITHNRGTIEAADALYGVTVGDDSVSRVISIRLDEAASMIDLEAVGVDDDPAGLGAAIAG